MTGARLGCYRLPFRAHFFVNTLYFQQIPFIFAKKVSVMAYTQININIKKPTKTFETFVRELGEKKNEYRKEILSRLNSAKKIEVK